MGLNSLEGGSQKSLLFSIAAMAALLSGTTSATETAHESTLADVATSQESVSTTNPIEVSIVSLPTELQRLIRACMIDKRETLDIRISIGEAFAGLTKSGTKAAVGLSFKVTRDRPEVARIRSFGPVSNNGIVVHMHTHPAYSFQGNSLTHGLDLHLPGLLLGGPSYNDLRIAENNIREFYTAVTEHSSPEDRAVGVGIVIDPAGYWLFRNAVADDFIRNPLFSTKFKQALQDERTARTMLRTKLDSMEDTKVATALARIAYSQKNIFITNLEEMSQPVEKIAEPTWRFARTRIDKEYPPRGVETPKETLARINRFRLMHFFTAGYSTMRKAAHQDNLTLAYIIGFSDQEIDAFDALRANSTILQSQNQSLAYDQKRIALITASQRGENLEAYIQDLQNTALEAGYVLKFVPKSDVGRVEAVAHTLVESGKTITDIAAECAPK